MEWQEQAIVLGLRKYGESSVIVETLTRDHGRHAGLVRSGRSRRMRPVLQPGNMVSVTWRARLEDHLGSFAVEPVSLKAAMVMSDAHRLAGLTTLTALCMMLPDREPQPELFDTAKLILQNLEHDDIWPALLVRWEAGLLDALGFGLDLSKCAATGATDDLVYVSPRSGRAVSRAGGEPYKAKLLALPQFLISPCEISTTDLINGLQLTGYFLHRHLFGPRDVDEPDARQRIIGWLEHDRFRLNHSEP